MNVMQMGQLVLSRAPLPVGNREKSVLRPEKPARTRGVFHRMERPSNEMTFLVSFLTYLVGIFPSMVYALPTGGSVQAGPVSINQVSESQLNILQSSDKAIIDWNSFSIADGKQVNFQLPSSNSVTLNRVTGNDPSSIFGKLTSNENLMPINRNGILFGNGAEVDVQFKDFSKNLSNH